MTDQYGDNHNLRDARRLLDDISANGRNLTKWEQDFVDSWEDKISTYGNSTMISGTIIDILERITAERCVRR